MSRSKVRIALTTRVPVAQSGGIESAVREISHRIASRRRDWDVLTIYAFSKANGWNGVPVIGDLIAAVALAFKGRQCDVVLVNGAEYAWPRMLRRAERERTIVVWHGTRAGEIPALVATMSLAVKVYHVVQTSLQRSALSACRQIAVSASTAREIECTYGPTREIRIISNGSPDLQGTAPSGSRGGHRVAWVGTNAYKKGLDIALAACELVRESYPDLELLVIGLNKVSTFEKEWVRYTGRVDHADSLEYLRSADVLLATSRYEGCSVAVIEALCLGLPIVASPRVAWMVEDAGVSVKGFMHQGYAEALSTLFAVPELLKGMSEAARRRARFFDWNVAADTYVAEIERCLKAQ